LEPARLFCPERARLSKKSLERFFMFRADGPEMLSAASMKPNRSSLMRVDPS
jgi:hypothetical protein